jgi:RsmE family RNA methyltransferase
VNLLLLDAGDLAADGTARVGGHRARHVAEVLRARPGDRIAVGLLGGALGEGEVLLAAPGELVLRVRLLREPPPPSPVSLLLALPRPKVLRRVLQAAAAMGVKRIALVGSWRVEKSYFSSPLLAPEAVGAELRLGLEQGRDTVLPRVSVHRFFRPFVEDELDGLAPGAGRLLAHPVADRALTASAPSGAAALLAVGPEGGFTAFEAGELGRRGFAPFSLGPRPLRVDAAVPFAVGQVELWLRGRVGPPGTSEPGGAGSPTRATAGPGG